jgi:hypothetical protein
MDLSLHFFIIHIKNGPYFYFKEHTRISPNFILHYISRSRWSLLKRAFIITHGQCTQSCLSMHGLSHDVWWQVSVRLSASRWVHGRQVSSFVSQTFVSVGRKVQQQRAVEEDIEVVQVRDWNWRKNLLCFGFVQDCALHLGFRNRT